MRNVPQILRHLNAWFPVGDALWGCYRTLRRSCLAGGSAPLGDLRADSLTLLLVHTICTHMAAHTHTSVPGYLISNSSLHGHQAHMSCTDMLQPKHTQLNKIIK